MEAVSGPIADNAKSEVPAQVETTDVVVEAPAVEAEAPVAEAVVTEEVVAEVAVSEPEALAEVAEVPAQVETTEEVVATETPAETPAE